MLSWWIDYDYMLVHNIHGPCELLFLHHLLALVTYMNLKIYWNSCYLLDFITSLLLQSRMMNAVSEVRQAIVTLTSKPADFEEVMFKLVSVLSDSLHDKSIIEAIMEDLFVQVRMSHVAKFWPHQVCFLVNEVWWKLVLWDTCVGMARLSRPGWLVQHSDGLPALRWLPILVQTWFTRPLRWLPILVQTVSGIVQLRRSRPMHYHWAKLPTSSQFKNWIFITFLLIPVHFLCENMFSCYWRYIIIAAINISKICTVLSPFFTETGISWYLLFYRCYSEPLQL